MSAARKLSRLKSFNESKAKSKAYRAEQRKKLAQKRIAEMTRLDTRRTSVLPSDLRVRVIPSDTTAASVPSYANPIP